MVATYSLNIISCFGFMQCANLLLVPKQPILLVTTVMYTLKNIFTFVIYDHIEASGCCHYMNSSLRFESCYKILAYLATTVGYTHKNGYSIDHLGQCYKQGSLTEVEGSVRLTSLYSPIWISSFYIKNIIYLFKKQATLMWRSTVLSLHLR
jgi:hypothetical protein